MTAALGGRNVLAFSGGIGEPAAGLCRRTEDTLGLLRLAVASACNVAVGAGPDTDINAAGVAAQTTVVHSRKKRSSPARYVPPSASAGLGHGVEGRSLGTWGDNRTRGSSITAWHALPAAAAA
ncbi:MAG: hypothetical protein M3332_17150 [Actinomycetota bacterium]|nr:hypothetical protein [Actinomycetota bacterium]